VDEMDAEMTLRWNETVGPRDLVYMLGDFAWRDHEKYLKCLQGKKILIEGNHDKMKAGIKARHFIEVHPGFLNRRFDNQHVTFCHYKMEAWYISHYGSYHFYAHSHGRRRELPDVKCCDVSADAWDFCPIPIEVLFYKMGQKVPRSYPPSGVVDAIVKENIKENRKMRVEYESLAATGRRLMI